MIYAEYTFHSDFMAVSELQQFQIGITDCASPNDTVPCIITDSLSRRSECTRLLAMDFFMDKIYKASNNAIISRI